MRRGIQAWPWLAVPGIVVAAEATAEARVYLTMEQAQQAIFPGETCSEMPLALTDQQKAAVKQQTGVTVRSAPRVWRTGRGGFLVVDEVLGKHEFITYAVGINPDGTVKQIEIMDYRESYGDEIRNEVWRKQFIGKSSADPLKLDQDIRNISGATLSSRHVTDGVKKVLAIHERYLTHP